MQAYDVVARLVPAVVRLAVKPNFRGVHHVPRTGGIIVAANHLSVADPFAVALIVHQAGRRPRFMAKASLFRIPLVGRLLRALGQIPVHRYTSDARRSLSAAADAVRAGEAVVIYPEGTTTHDPDYLPMQARTGVARLALETGAPVVPVAHWGAQEFLGRRGRFRPFPRKTLTVVAGAPVRLDAWTGAKMDARTLRECTDAIMHEISVLVAEIREERAAGVTDGTRRTA